jgi:hypothetical protein
MPRNELLVSKLSTLESVDPELAATAFFFLGAGAKMQTDPIAHAAFSRFLCPPSSKNAAPASRTQLGTTPSHELLVSVLNMPFELLAELLELPELCALSDNPCDGKKASCETGTVFAGTALKIGFAETAGSVVAAGAVVATIEVRRQFPESVEGCEFPGGFHRIYTHPSVGSFTSVPET